VPFDKMFSERDRIAAALAQRRQTNLQNF
jgi:hypothetical protein